MPIPDVWTRLKWRGSKGGPLTVTAWSQNLPFTWGLARGPPWIYRVGGVGETSHSGMGLDHLGPKRQIQGEMEPLM